MNRKLVLRLTSVGLLIANGVVGCSPSIRQSHPDVALARFSPDQFGQHAADRATAALAARDSAGAVNAAEVAVASAPGRADYRALLGQAYLASGRFGSADAAFASASQIDPVDGKAAFGHVLALIGEGQTEAARAALAGLPASVPAADRGLAQALAGDRKGAIAVLEHAARAPGADARTRQNLALAYALDGDWTRASATAAQDVPAGDLPTRLASWASFTNAGNPADQVAMLLGTARAAEAGIPVQLARAPVIPAAAPAAKAPVAVALAAPTNVVAVTAPAPVPAPPPLLAAATPAPFARIPLAAAVPVRLASAGSVRAPLLRAAVLPYKRAAATPRVLPTRMPVPAPRGNFVVQLGAFRDPSRVERAWSQSTARLARLASYTPSSTTFLSAERSAALTRLSIAGFGSRAAALAVCGALKSAGGSCFVRAQAGDNPIHWASRDTDKRA